MPHEENVADDRHECGDPDVHEPWQLRDAETTEETPRARRGAGIGLPTTFGLEDLIDGTEHLPDRAPHDDERHEDGGGEQDRDDVVERREPRHLVHVQIRELPLVLLHQLKEVDTHDQCGRTGEQNEDPPRPQRRRQSEPLVGRLCERAQRASVRLSGGVARAEDRISLTDRVRDDHDARRVLGHLARRDLLKEQIELSLESLRLADPSEHL